MGDCDYPEENMYMEELGDRPPELEEIRQRLNELVLQLFNAADDDSDGLLDPEETEDFAKGFEMTYPGMMLGIMDEDGNGRTTLPEAQSCVERAFFPELMKQLRLQKGYLVDHEKVPLSEEPIINRDGVVIRW